MLSSHLQSQQRRGINTQVSQVRPINWHTHKIVNHSYIWKDPDDFKVEDINQMLHNHGKYAYQVQPQKEAMAILIARQGKLLGWVKPNDLKLVRKYRLPYQYTSQFYPSKAKDACEIAALKIAMSTHGKAMNISLNRMVRKIPLTNNPNIGYTGDPYHYGTH